MAGMQRTDSSSIMSSLQMDYGDSDEEETLSRNNSRTEEESLEPITSSTEANDGPTSPEDKEKESESVNEVKQETEVSPLDFISDDDDNNSKDGTHHHRRHKHHHHHHRESDDDNIRKQAVREALNTDSPSSQGSTKAAKKATRLVSYGNDDMEDENSSSEEEEDITDSPALNAADASVLSRSVQNMSNDEIQLPPEPPGKCPYPLQKKIETMYERMRKEGFDFNRSIQSRKNFRNPSIYDKLIDFCHIDEKGTNFPPEIYDPHVWGKESFYDELDKVQRKDMEKREKDKKERTKIEFISGTKKPSSSSDMSGISDEKKRKSKWDAQPTGSSHIPQLSASQQPGVVNLTSSVTGTKATVISAVGSLTKKSSSSTK